VSNKSAETHTINKSKKQELIICVVLAMATLAVFWQLHEYNFTNYDDPVYVTGNSFIRSGITPDALKWAFGTKYYNLWHPLVWLSFMIDYQFYGMKAGGYHLTNILIHMLSALMLFWLFRRMTGEIWKSAFVAAFFALHPLHVESVAWIAERKDVLSAFFWMLTLTAYVYYAEKPDIKKYLLVLASFLCALMSKPMVVTLPVVMILLDYWPLSRFQPKVMANIPDMPKQDPSKKGKRKSKSQKENAEVKTAPAVRQALPESKVWGIIPVWQIKEKAPFFLLSAVIILVNLYTSDKKVYEHFSLGARLANAPVAFVTYLEKSFLPHDLAILYPFSAQIPAWQVAGSVLLIIAVTAAIIAAVKRLPYLFVGWFWFAATILPVIGILQISTSAPFSMADRYHYLTSIGIAVMAAWGIPALLPREQIYKKILFAAAAVFLLVLAVLTWQQCHYWKNSKELWSHALNVTKNNYVAHNNLGPSLFNEGKTEEALEHFRKAIELKPDYSFAYNNRGNMYAEMGRYEEAVRDYDQAVKLTPDDATAYNNRGTIYSDTGRYGQAIEDFTEAIRLKPGYPDAYYNRGNAFGKSGRFQQALDDFSTAIRLKENYADAYVNRGITYFMMNNEELGCSDLRQACALGQCRILQEAGSKGACRRF